MSLRQVPLLHRCTACGHEIEPSIKERVLVQVEYLCARDVRPWYIVMTQAAWNEARREGDWTPARMEPMEDTFLGFPVKIYADNSPVFATLGTNVWVEAVPR